MKYQINLALEFPAAPLTKPNQTQPNPTKSKQTQPNPTKPNQAQPKPTTPNQIQPNPVKYQEQEQTELNQK